MFVPNFKILSQVVSEKSLTEKKFTDRQTDRQTDKHPYGKGKNYISPIYFVYRGYKNGRIVAYIVKLVWCKIMLVILHKEVPFRHFN